MAFIHHPRRILTSTRSRLLAAALMAVPAVCSAAAPPATQPEVTAAPTTRPSSGAVALLQRVNAAYAALNFAEFDGNVIGHFDVAGQHKDQQIPFTSAFAAPNQFHHQAKGQLLLGSTGTKVYAYEPSHNVYIQSDAPAGRATLAQWPQMFASLLQNQNPSLLLALTSTSSDSQSNALASLGDDMVQLPDTSIGNAHCPTLQFHPPGQGTVTFVLDPQTALLRQARYDLREPLVARGAADVKAADVTIDYSPTPTTQPATPADTAKLFAWTPPANATLASASTAPAPSGDSDSAAQGLVGKPAPDFTLSDLNDKKVKLADQHGSVVVVDFWATWCGPCVQSLPHLDDLYKQESPHGLRAFAVNLQEDKDHVKSFVQSKGWSLPVLLDTDGSVAQQYHADAIPETVIVGKDGNVKDVFIGSGHEDDIKSAVSKEMGS